MVRGFFVGMCVIGVLFSGCEKVETGNKRFDLAEVFVGSESLSLDGMSEGLPIDRSITLVFSLALNQTSASGSIQVLKDQQPVNINITFPSGGQTVVIFPQGTLLPNTVYTIQISGSLRAVNGETFASRDISFKTAMAALEMTSAQINENEIKTLARVANVPLNLALKLQFSAPLNTTSLEQAAVLTGDNVSALNFVYSDNNQTVLITTTSALIDLEKYQFRIMQGLKGAGGQSFPGFSTTLYTAVDLTPKFPLIADEELLTLVQQQTFKYFWDFAHPASGMARERNTSGDIVTTGGSGFGIMTLIVGMERNFISRNEGLERMDKILTFLENADRFHGVWPHWLNGATGDVVPFSANDNGGDLVETSFLVQGLLTFRQYLDTSIADEKSLIDRINVLWETVEWDWYTHGGQHVLYWHWSPDREWIMNHPIRGYNEALITYFLAAASPTHTVDAVVYHEGWADNGGIRNNKSFYGTMLPLGYDYGGPLFFAHYSFLGLDPRNLQDTYGDYWAQNVNHTLINHAYSADNPKGYVGYSDENWGLTASDDQNGYSAHSPTNDSGVITPTAALSSFPYAPEESMKALKFFYYTLGDRLWGPYGFYDAFNITESWTADSYLAIDQGPIIVMIENYRSALLWNLFMSAPEVNTGMNTLGFTN
jgi:hypothetical protein